MNNNNISLSLELICLMSWLLKNEKQGLNTLIKQAVQHGFSEELEKVESLDHSMVSEKLYTTILDFLVLLEQILMKNLETINLDTTTKDAILPALEQMDLDSLDDRTIWLSMQQTKDKLHKHHTHNHKHKHKHHDHAEEKPTKQASNEHAKKILFEQLIKNWKPTKNEPLH